MEETTTEEPKKKRNRRRPKGNAEATRTDVNPKGGSDSAGTAAHDNSLSTRQATFPLRPSSPMLEMDGRSYSGYGDASPRIDLPLLIAMPSTFNILGWRGVARGTTADGPAGTPFADMPGLNRVATIARNLYEEVVFMGEARDGFKQLPATLHNDGVLIEYIQRYMLIVAKLVTLISVQQLTTYDIVSRRIGLVGSTVSRSKLRTALETITALPMYPVFHNLAVMMGTPIISGTPTGPILVRTFPFHGPDQSIFGDVSTSGDHPHVGVLDALNHVSQKLKDNPTDLLDVYAKLHDSEWWNREYADILTLIKAMERIDISSEYREDFLAIQALMRILKVPVNYMTYTDISVGAAASPALTETILSYGAYVGKQTRTGTDVRVMGPDADWTNGLVEMRYPGGVGLPHMLGMFGTVFTRGGNIDVSETTTGGYQFGLLGEIQTAVDDTDPTLHEYKSNGCVMLRRVYREDAGVSDVWSIVDEDAKESDEFKNYPIAQHWWRDLATAGNGDPTIYRDRATDRVYFIPVEDFGWHYLKWFTTAMGVPTRL